MALLHFKLKGTRAWEALPQSLQQKIRAAAYNETAAEMLWEQEIEEVIDKLGGTHIQPLVFKGTALAYSLYAQPHLRSRSDTDLLFAHRDAAEQAWAASETGRYQVFNRLSK